MFSEPRAGPPAGGPCTLPSRPDHHWSGWPRTAHLSPRPPPGKRTGKGAQSGWWPRLGWKPGGRLPVRLGAEVVYGECMVVYW